MSSTIVVEPRILYGLCKKFFEKEDEKTKKRNQEYRKKLYTERRLFGLLPPKYKKEEVDSWESHGIWDSMAFQTMWPHHQLYALQTAAEVAMKAGVYTINVEARLFAELK